MADVTGGRDSGRFRPRDRGQLFLVGALSLAVLFVVLALLMNTAIYTENIATRGTGSGTDEAIRYGQAVRAGTAGLVGYANAHHNATNGTLYANTSAGVDALSDATSVHYAYEGTRAEASLVGTTNGTRIVHDDETRAFTNESGTADWTVASSADGVRAFRLNVTRSALTAVDAADDVTDLGSVFRVEITDATASSTWRAYIYSNTTANAVSVKVKNGSEVLGNGACTGPSGAEHVVVDLTRGTVGGEPCPLLDFAKGVSGPYDVGFVNGDRAKGTYGLVVRGTPLGGEPNGMYSGDASNSPHVTHAIYSATVRVTYEGSRISYRTNVTVAPGDGR